jgi:hypothetical protein
MSPSLPAGTKAAANEPRKDQEIKSWNNGSWPFRPESLRLWSRVASRTIRTLLLPSSISLASAPQ